MALVIIRVAGLPGSAIGVAGALAAAADDAAGLRGRAIGIPQAVDAALVRGAAKRTLLSTKAAGRGGAAIFVATARHRDETRRDRNSKHSPYDVDSHRSLALVRRTRATSAA